MTEPRREEKEEKEEKGRDESWDEKWRNDPVGAATWALVLIWAGIAWLLSNLGAFDGLLGDGWDVWPVIFLGAGIIVLLSVGFRLVVPAYRRPITGGIILGLILIGIGLGGITDGWVVIGPLVLIGIGLAGIAAYFFRRDQ
jgi:hypothetical protein